MEHMSVYQDSKQMKAILQNGSDNRPCLGRGPKFCQVDAYVHFISIFFLEKDMSLCVHRRDQCFKLTLPCAEVELLVRNRNGDGRSHEGRFGMGYASQCTKHERQVSTMVTALTNHCKQNFSR